VPNAVLCELPYHRRSSDLFSQIRHLPYAVWLDSSFPDGYKGRFDIMAAEPSRVIQTADQSVFSELRAILKEDFSDIHSPDPDLPFMGGAIGFLNYNLSDERLKHYQPPQHVIATPQSNIGIYHWALIQDHRRRRCVLVCSPKVGAEKRQALKRVFTEEIEHMPCKAKLRSPFVTTISKQEYQQGFQKIQDYILAGDCYQVNYTQHFSAPFSGDPWAAYQILRHEAKAPFSAFFNTPEGTVLSVSPERFIKVSGRHVETKPIKGTQPRHEDAFVDAELARKLCNSEKDKSENLMIVDLMRNDIGKHCATGSVMVDKLFELESYSNVHHLVSTISGELAPNADAIHLLEDCFPGGSITGAPKLRSMEIINELEACQRSVYCGSMFYLSADGKLDSSICIRTMLVENGTIHCWGGGGIVADSNCDSEYRESIQKVERFMKALELKLT